MLVASNTLVQRLTLSRRRYNLSEFSRYTALPGKRIGAAGGHSWRRSMTVKFRVELVWTDADNAASSIFLTADGRIILQGRAVSPQERTALALPAQGQMISVDRNLIRAIKDML